MVVSNSSDLWMIALISSDNKVDAITMHLAKVMGVNPIRYNELAHIIMRMVESSGGPREFWDKIDSERKALFLNDAESAVFGAMLCNVLIKLPKPVFYGKKLAEINGIDYDAMMKDIEEHEQICLGKMGGVKGQ